MNLNPTIKLPDGRHVKRPTGEKTVIATGEWVAHTDSYHTYFMGEHWEFTGRIQYQSNPNWTETYVSFEIVYVWKERHDWLPWKQVERVKVDWLSSVHYSYATNITYVECEQS